MNQLRLVHDDSYMEDDQPEVQAGVPREALPFPTAAVHVMNRERLARLTTRVSGGGEHTAWMLEKNIMRELARAQLLVNRLNSDVDSLRFPEPRLEDDLPPPPRAA